MKSIASSASGPLKRRTYKYPTVSFDDGRPYMLDLDNNVGSGFTGPRPKPETSSARKDVAPDPPTPRRASVSATTTAGAAAHLAQEGLREPGPLGAGRADRGPSV
jgi:hypothetical protein